MNLRLMRGAAMVLVMGAAVRPARAQTPGELLAAARAQLINLNVDSAAALLRRVDDGSRQATRSERALARVLEGIGELTLVHEPKARAAFREALSLDPDLRVDSLASLHSQFLRVFAEVRAEPPLISVTIPADTLIAADSGVVRIAVRASRPTPVTVTLGTEGGTTPFYNVSQLIADSAVFLWPPGETARAPEFPLALSLAVTAHDPAGDRVAFTASLRAERAAVDTLRLPPPLAAGVFLPESTYRWAHQSRSLLAGIGFGAAAATLGALGNQGSGGDSRAFAVGGALSFAGIIGYFKGRYGNHPIPANVARNREQRRADAALRDSIEQINAGRRADAEVRILVTRSPR